MNRIEYVVEVGLSAIIVGKDLIYIVGSLGRSNQWFIDWFVCLDIKHKKERKRENDFDKLILILLNK